MLLQHPNRPFKICRSRRIQLSAQLVFPLKQYRFMPQCCGSQRSLHASRSAANDGNPLGLLCLLRLLEARQNRHGKQRIHRAARLRFRRLGMAFVAADTGGDIRAMTGNQLFIVMAVADKGSCHIDQVCAALPKKLFVSRRIMKAANGRNQQGGPRLFQRFGKAQRTRHFQIGVCTNGMRQLHRLRPHLDNINIRLPNPKVGAQILQGIATRDILSADLNFNQEMFAACFPHLLERFQRQCRGAAIAVISMIQRRGQGLCQKRASIAHIKSAAVIAQRLILPAAQGKIIGGSRQCILGDFVDGPAGGLHLHQRHNRQRALVVNRLRRVDIVQLDIGNG